MKNSFGEFVDALLLPGLAPVLSRIDDVSIMRCNQNGPDGEGIGGAIVVLYV